GRQNASGRLMKSFGKTMPGHQRSQASASAILLSINELRSPAVSLERFSILSNCTRHPFLKDGWNNDDGLLNVQTKARIQRNREVDFYPSQRTVGFRVMLNHTIPSPGLYQSIIPVEVKSLTCGCLIAQSICVGIAIRRPYMCFSFNGS